MFAVVDPAAKLGSLGSVFVCSSNIVHYCLIVEPEFILDVREHFGRVLAAPFPLSLFSKRPAIQTDIASTCDSKTDPWSASAICGHFCSDSRKCDKIVVERLGIFLRLFAADFSSVVLETPRS